MAPDPSPELPPFDVLYEHAGFVRALARGLVGDKDLAEDVAQEALIAAWRRPPRKSVRAWLAVVTRNLAISARRSRTRRVEREKRGAKQELGGSVDEAVSRLELQRRMSEAVLSLDEPYKTTVLLRFFYELSLRETAERMGTPLQTVRTRQRRGLELLRARLDASHGGDRRAWSVAMLAFLPSVRTPAAVSAGKGILIMSAKTKFGLSAAVLLVAGGLIWHLSAKETIAVSRAEHGETAALPLPSKGEESPAEPSPIDLDRVDRDRDLHGMVASVSGGPVPGAAIEAVAYPWRRGMVLNSDAQQRTRSGPKTISGPDGSFSLRLHRGALVNLRVFAEGFAPLEAAQHQAGERVEIVLRPAVALEVAVEERDGRPVPGFRLRLRKMGARSVFDHSVVTGEEGIARFEGLPGRTDALLLYGRTGSRAFGVKGISLPAAGTRSIRLALPPVVPVTGIVVDAETKEPIAHAVVGLDWVLDNAVHTGADGRFEFEAWTRRDGIDRLHVVADGYGRAIAVLSKKRKDLEIHLERGDAATGRIVDAGSRAVSGARVSAIAYHGGPAGLDSESMCLRHTETDASGRFDLSGLHRRMPHTLVVMAPGHGRLLLDFDPREGGPGTIDFGVVKLPRALAIEGRVLDANAQPLARAYVELRGANADRGRLRPGKPPLEHSYGNREARYTDDLGRFRFPDLSPGEYAFETRLQGLAGPKTLVVLGNEDVLDVELKRAPSRTLDVFVADERGQPIGDIDVMLRTDSGWLEEPTNEQGHARFTTNLTMLSVRATPVRKEKRQFLTFEQSESTAVRPGQTELDLVLKDAARVTGRVVDDKGDPVAGMLIWVHQDGKLWDGYPTRFKTDERGAFTTVVPKTGQVSLTMSKGAAGEIRYLVSEQVEPGATRLLFVATIEKPQSKPRDRSVSVKLVAPDGTGVSGVPIAISGGVPPRRSLRMTEADGTCVFEKLTGEEHWLLISTRLGHPTRLRWVTPQMTRVLPEGQEVVLRYQEGEAITGRALLPKGRQASFLIIKALRAGKMLSSTMANKDGAFRLLVPAGTPDVTLEAVAAQPESYRGSVERVRPGDDVEIRLQRSP